MDDNYIADTMGALTEVDPPKPQAAIQQSSGGSGGGGLLNPKQFLGVGSGAAGEAGAVEEIAPLAMAM